MNEVMISYCYSMDCIFFLTPNQPDSALALEIVILCLAKPLNNSVLYGVFYWMICKGGLCCCLLSFLGSPCVSTVSGQFFTF